MDSEPSAVSPRKGSDGEVIEEETWFETRYFDCLGLVDRFRDFAWDPVHRTVLGRDKKSWGEIGVFYLIFYSALAAFWGIALVLFLETVPAINEGPKYNNLINIPGISASKRTIDARVNSTNSDLAAANRKLLEGSFYRNQTQIDNLNIGPAARCNVTEGSVSEVICIYLSVNRVFRWIPDQQLDIVCNLKTEAAVKKYGSGIFSVVHTTFPASLFQEGQVHYYTPGSSVFRSPVTIVVFNLPPGMTGNIEVECKSRRSILAVNAEFELKLT